MTDCPDDWRRLISKFRELCPGPLTYAVNWWGDYDVVEFWDELDYIGINAFFPLTLEEEATDLATLSAGLGPLRTRSRPSTSERVNPCC